MKALPILLLVAAGILPGSISVAHAAEAGNAERGMSAYARNCASCHGAAGRGDGPVARALRPPPTDFTAAPIKPDRAYQVTRDGGAAAGLAPTMPAFARTLSEQEMRDISAYITSLYGQSADGGSK